MRVLCVLLSAGGLFACASTNATGRLPAHLVDATGVAIPGRPVGLRSTDGVHFIETDVPIAMDQVPGPVRALRGSACPNREGTVRYARHEVEGTEAYTVYVGDGPRSCAVTARPNGVRLRVDRAVDPAALPAGVVRAIEGIFHDDFAVVEAFSRSVEHGDDTVEVLVRKAGQEYVLVLTTGGTLQLRMRRYPAVLDVPDR